MYNNSRVELGYALMTFWSESKICGVHKKSRVELGCTNMNVKNENQVSRMHKKAEWTFDGQK